MLRRFAVVACLALVSSPALGADALPLGLDGLHWGMSLEAAEAAFSLFAKVPATTQIPPGKTIKIGIPGYAWHGCTFVGMFRFGPAGLSDIQLVQSDATKECRDDVLAALNAQYGEAVYKYEMGFGFYNWPGDAATVPDVNNADVGMASAKGGYGVIAHFRPRTAQDPAPPAKP